MYPTLFTIGKWSIPSYTVLLDLGLILGLVLTYFEGKRVLGKGDIALDLGLWVVIGGIVGGRIGYVLANWTAFSEDWSQVLRLWQGGLSFYGAFLGGLAVMGLFSWLGGRQNVEGNAHSFPSFLTLADVATPGLALGMAFGWAACLMGGCAYGAIGVGFGTALLPDLYGVEASRFATQVAGLVYAILLFASFWLLRRRWPFTGAAFLMYILLYFGGMFFLEFARGDEAIYVGPWRLAQWLDLSLTLAAAASLLLLWWRTHTTATSEAAEIEAQEDMVGSPEPFVSDPPHEVG